MECAVAEARFQGYRVETLTPEAPLPRREAVLWEGVRQAAGLFLATEAQPPAELASVAAYYRRLVEARRKR